MPRRCSVRSCRSNYRDRNSVGKYVSCYGFPSDAHISKKWLIAIGRPNYVPNYDSAVCAKHFDASSFLRKDMYRGFNGELKAFEFAKPKLKNNAVPTLFLGVGRETNVDKTDRPFAAQKKAVTPLSTLYNDVQRDGEDMMVKQHDVDDDDTRTCMDFVEVEMKDPDNRDENLCDSQEFRTKHCLSGRRIGQSAKMRIYETTRTERCNTYPVISIRNGFQEKFVNDEATTLLQRSPSCVFDAKNVKFVTQVMGRLGGANVLNHTSDLSVVTLDRGRKGHRDIIKTANNIPEGPDQKNCEVGVVTKVEDKGSPCDLVVNLGNREEEVISSEDCQGKDNLKATLINCSVSSSTCGEIRGKVGSVNSCQTFPVGGGSNYGFLNSTRKTVSLKDCGFVKDVVCVESGVGVKESGVTPHTENVDLVLIDANGSRSDGTKDFEGSLGNAEVKACGQNRGSEKYKDGEDEGPSEVQEWEGGWAVKEELFRGLGLVPRGVLHDRSVDRRHCVRGQRRSEVSTKRLRSPTKTAVFYPPGTAMFDTEKFIGEIQKRPAIYDVRSKVYSNRVAKLKYWHEVGKEMYKGWDILDQMERRTLVKELQIKWKSIRDHFMRQLKQNMNGEGPKKKKYVHFDQLQFLTANLGVKRPRHSFKPPKHEPEEEYMELTPELPEERHFSFMTSVERPDYDEHEVPVAAALLPQQPEDLSYHPKEVPFHHHQELSYHKELEGDRMGNKMFLLSLLPIMERLPDHSNIRARLQLMEVLQTFVAHEDASHRDFYNYHDEKQSCGDASQQHSTASHTDSDT